MQTKDEPTSLKELLKKAKVPVREINRFTAYVNNEKRAESTKDKKPVTSNDSTMLYNMFIKFWNLGLTIDGVNVVITGRGMALPTYHGYKNKVKQIYADATFDVQLVRENDTVKFAKESGAVVYTHDIGDPFSEKPIVGAYCVIKFGGNEYLETLNKQDYLKMRDSSKNPSTWNKWESEFWLKSVIKRACKRHFNDITVELDKVDNEMFGLVDRVKATDDKLASIIEKAKAQDEAN